MNVSNTQNKTDTLLIEIGTEELPPNALQALSQAFLKNIGSALNKLDIPYGKATSYVTPRRIAVRIEALPLMQPSRTLQRKGPALNAAFDATGKPTQATLGFARSCKMEVTNLEKLETPQGSWLIANQIEAGQSLVQLIPGLFSQFIQNLPIPKRMRWADLNEEFVRPVHWIVALHGAQIIPITAFGLQAGNKTYGHRFHHPEAITLQQADDYVEALRAAKVIADFEERKQSIIKGLESLSMTHKATPKIDPELLTEVTGLVEWPSPLIANFDVQFLAIPKEALISCMQHHQRCFPLLDKGSPTQEKLLNKFILISNMAPVDPANIIEGNQRVMHARLSDAQFFFEQDKKQPLSSHAEGLQKMIFQHKLGSLFEKMQRVEKLAVLISEKIGGDPKLSQRAAQLYKTDLLTNMVGEFPELQGIMGSYYAALENENPEVCSAIKESYLPRFAKDELPQTPTGLSLSLADRLDTLVGIFSIQAPTGEKDPFALRRQAIAILRILVEKNYDLDLRELLASAYQGYTDAGIFDIKKHNNPVDTIVDFCFERFRFHFQEEGVETKILDSLLSPVKTTNPLDFSLRVKGLYHFQTLPESEALAAANKRVQNILTKSEGVDTLPPPSEPVVSQFQEPAEKDLYHAIKMLESKTLPLIEKKDYTQALSLLAQLKAPIDAFFDTVMVNVDDAVLRHNRMLLLINLHQLLGQIADLSKLS